MPSLLYINRENKERSIIKMLNGGLLKLRYSSSPRDGIQAAIKHPADIILLDMDKSPITAKQFVHDLRVIHIFTPVVAISSLPEGLFDDINVVAGYVQKPSGQSDFQNTLNQVLKEEELLIKKELQEGRECVELADSELLIGFRREANIYKVSKKGMVLFLPTAIAPNSKILFKGTSLYQQLNLEGNMEERIELVVVECVATANNSFKITAHFASGMVSKMKSELDRHIGIHAEKCAPMPFGNPTLLLVGDSQDTIQNYRFFLKDSNYHLESAFNVDDVFEKIQDLQIDLLLIDTDLLEVFGQSILDGLKDLKLRLPTVFITNQSNPKIVQEFAPKVQDFIIKPVNGRSLHSRIKQVFDRWKTEVKVEQDIGENLGVHIKTRILVAFRDVAQIKRVRKNGLLIYKKHPIVPTTPIYCKASILFGSMGLQNEDVTHLELIIERCDPDEEHGYRIIAKFKDVPSNIGQMITSFVDGNTLTSSIPQTDKNQHRHPEKNKSLSGSSPTSDASGQEETETHILGDFEKQLANAKVEPVLTEKVGDGFFPAQPSEYIKKLNQFKSITRELQGELQALVDRSFPSISTEFSKKKFEHMTGRREQLITYRIFTDTTEAFFQLGAVLTNVPKGMGISASLVEDQYRYAPYFNFGIPGNPIKELGEPLLVRKIGEKQVQIYDYNKSTVLSYAKTIIGLISNQ